MRSALESSDEHLRLLGIVAARWATLDMILMSLVGLLLGDMTNALSVYYSSSSQKPRFDMILALLRSSTRVNDSKKEEIKRLIKKLQNLSRKRNEIIHCYATEKYAGNIQGILNRGMRGNADRVEYQAIRHRPAYGVIFEEIPLTTKFLNDHIEALSDTADALLDLIFPPAADSDDVQE